MSEPRFVVGIDLGTTNSVIAFAELSADTPQVQLLPVPQLVAASTVEARSSLPSFLYLAAEHEAADNAFDLPWSDSPGFAVGVLARGKAAEMPERTVAAAKSWLCHSRVDRRLPILPWNAPAEVAKISPVTAAQRYLEHLAAAWHAAHGDAPLAEQHVVLTVPASFDAMARELTREAAIAAGLPEDLLLIEEPQAAVYSWLAAVGDDWRKTLNVDDRLLVCDVGGGTSDFTLIRVAEEAGDLSLVREAVGDHLLVGGDNMDLALAHFVSSQFAEKGVKLNPWQSVSLWHSSRAAKETLLAEGGPKKHKISVLGRGKKLIGGTVSVEVDRDTVAGLLVDGFFPKCKRGDQPDRGRASGFQEIGLPFESDAAVTRHLAAFLGRQDEESETPTHPTHLLFNGGVFKSESLRARLVETLDSWSRKKTGVAVLDDNHDLDFAVARGAAYYGWTKQRGGVRIRGGTARSYYIGIETAGLAIPGAPRPLRALCVVPFGMEEGTETDVPSNEIGVVLGEPAKFRFFSSSTRKEDTPGNQLDSWDNDELTESDPLEASLPADEDSDDSYVPVQFQSRITELGMFELWCVHAESDRRWKLEFSVRDDAEE